MADFLKTKELLERANFVKILPNENYFDETFCASLALFYSLRELDKNVNLIIKQIAIPKKFQFLIEKEPNFFSSFENELTNNNYNFELTIKELLGEISEVFYEKNCQELKFFLKTKGTINNKDISLKPLKESPEEAILITFEAKKSSLDSNPKKIFIDIDRSGNIHFFSEIVFKMIKLLNIPFNNVISNCLLTGIIIETQNLKGLKNNNPEIFELMSFLIKNGADYQKITNKLFESSCFSHLELFHRILNKLDLDIKKNTAFLYLDEQDFYETNSHYDDLFYSIEKLKGVFPWKNLIFIFKKQGIFWSPNKILEAKIKNIFGGIANTQGIIFKFENYDLGEIKNKILEII